MAEAKAYKMIPHCTKDTITYDMDELVRCKDCKHWSNKMILDYHVCTRLQKQIKNFATKPDWFCADGKPKD